MRKRKVVYFIQRGEDGPIKIGETKNDLVDRLKALQVGSAERLRLLGYVRSEEAKMHERFRRHRIAGEWFRPHRDILDFVRTGMIKFQAPAPRIIRTKEVEKIIVAQWSERFGVLPSTILRRVQRGLSGDRAVR